MVGFEDKKAKLNINEAMKTVASHLSRYPQWVDGLHDSGSIEWDGIVQIHEDQNYVSAIIQLKKAISDWDDYSEDLTSFGLHLSNKENYLESLEHMEISARY